MALDRNQFLRLGAVSVLAGVVGRTGVAAAQDPAPAPAPAGPTPQGDDVSYVLWGATAEMVSIAYYTRALADGKFSPRAARRLRAARTADRDHLRRLKAVLGEDAPSEDDLEIVLPDNAFKTRARILDFGIDLERRITGVYLDGVARTTDEGTRLLLGRLLISDGQHLTMLRGLDHRPQSDAGLRAPVRISQASPWLDRFLRSRSFPTR